jgi:hypothetical protein
MKLSEKQQVFCMNASMLIKYIFSKGYSCTFGETYRTPEQAEIYFKQGTGIKNSLHCKRLAIDLNLFSPSGEYLTDSKEYEMFGNFWQNLHPSNRWGGTFPKPDGNHFEMKDS